MRAGSQSLLTTHATLVRIEDILMGTRWVDEQSFQGKAINFSGRLSKLILLDVPIDYFTVVLLHEYIGHGARYRELDIPNIDYGYDLPPPYGKGGGQASTSIGPGVISRHEEIAIWTGGLESHQVLNSSLRKRWMVLGEQHYREALTYFWSFQISLTYIQDTEDLYPAMDNVNDPQAYIRLLNLNNGYADVLNLPFSLDDLKHAMNRNAFDPMVLISMYNGLIKYLWSGNPISIIPMLKFGSVKYLPSMHVGLTPFGVETHLVYRGPLFLRGFDTDVREFVKEEILKKGIHLHFDSNIEEIVQEESGRLVSNLGASTIDSDMVLYATGRRPLIDGLGLESVGVELKPNSSVKVDDYYQTTVPSIYAIGDVIGGFQLTPVALAEGMAIVDNLVKGQKRKVDYSNIATAVFCQPNIGTVGLSAEDAEQKYPGDITLFKSDFKHLKHTLSGLDERTYMKLVVQTSTDIVLGAHMVGSDAGEIIQGLAIALKCGATKAQFDSTIGIHPTAAEEFVTMRTPS